MDTSWNQLASTLLCPAQPRLPQCRARAQALAAREARATERRHQLLADCRARIEHARASVFEIGNGVVGAQMTTLEREWLELARPPRTSAEATRELWNEMAPRRWADAARWQNAGDHRLDVETAITLACDPDGVERAEQCARELARSLIEWKVETTPHVTWHVAAEPPCNVQLAALFAGPLAAVHESIASTYGAESLTARADRIAADVETALAALPRLADRPTLAADVALVARLDFLWRACATESRTVPAGYTRVTRDFAATANPAAALLGLWQTGYVLAAVLPDGVTLGARLPAP